MNKILTAILLIILISTLPGMMMYLSIDASIEYKRATKNCQSNGWDKAGHVGRILDKNFKCYNYTKAEHDALVSGDEQ